MKRMNFFFRKKPLHIRNINNDNFNGMRIHFLGTSSQHATPDRNVTSVGLQLHGETFLFDCGEGTYRQTIFHIKKNPQKSFRFGSVKIFKIFFNFFRFKKFLSHICTETTYKKIN
jgi:hypothetical protein